MNYVLMDDVKENMILAESVVSNDGNIELLKEGTRMNSRHIRLLKRLKIEFIAITDDSLVEESIISESSYSQNIQKSLIKEDIGKVEYENKLIKAERLGNVISIEKKYSKHLIKINKLFDQLYERSTIDIKHVQKNIEIILPTIIESNDIYRFVQLIKGRSNIVFNHSLKVMIYAVTLAKLLKYKEYRIKELACSAMLFDIGKLKLPKYLLNKTDKFNREEFEIYKKHAQWSYNILMKSPDVSFGMKYAALQHHERLDGNGYPLKLKATQIHEYAKIIMICDVFVSLVYPLEPSQGISPYKALDYLRMNSENKFDSELVDLLIENLTTHSIGKKVVLTNGKKGKIIMFSKDNKTHPVIDVNQKVFVISSSESVSIDKII